MTALLYPANRTKGGIQWGLVVQTATMFAFATVATALSLDLQSISCTDDRNFPGFRDGSAPGPLGYQLLVYSRAINVVPNLMFLLNQWLADGLLVSSVFGSVAWVSNGGCPPLQLYRCYLIYAMKYWIVALPFLMYLASLGMYSSPPQTYGGTLG